MGLKEFMAGFSASLRLHRTRGRRTGKASRAAGLAAAREARSLRSEGQAVVQGAVDEDNGDEALMAHVL